MQTIIFDFGNVIAFFDHNRTLEKLRPFTSWTTEQMYDSVYGSPWIHELDCGTLAATDFLQRIHQLWQLRCDQAFLTHAVGDIFWPNPEVCELIPRLKKRYRLLLGSNTNAIHADHFVQQFADVLGHFDALVMSHEIRVRKPNAEFFLQCHRLANANPSQCVFVDDLTANIEGARSVGFHGIVYEANGKLSQQLQEVGIDV